MDSEKEGKPKERNPNRRMNQYHLENTKLFNFQAGELKVMKIIGEDKVIRNVLRLNDGRYEIIITDEGNFFYMFKRDPFYTWGDRFGKAGEVGDTINTNDVDRILEHDCIGIYSAFSDGSVYFISVKDFLSKAKTWICREGKEVASISLNDYQKL